MLVLLDHNQHVSNNAETEPVDPFAPPDSVSDSDSEATATLRRGRGRPRGSFVADIPWIEIEKAYIYGDPLEGAADDPAMVSRRRYPALRELGLRFGVHYSLIGRRARSLNWLNRRETFKKALDEETDRAVAKSAALSTADAVGLIDNWIGRFEGNLREKRVRADNVSDLNTIMRLREFLLGNADTRGETTHVLTLDVMQARFAERINERRTIGETRDNDALAGILSGEAPGHALDATPPPVEVSDNDERGEGIAGNIQKPQSIEIPTNDVNDLA